MLNFNTRISKFRYEATNLYIYNGISLNLVFLELDFKCAFLNEQNVL